MTTYLMIKDSRLLPLERHVPAEEYDDFDEDMLMVEKKLSQKKKYSFQLYMAS